MRGGLPSLGQVARGPCLASMGGGAGEDGPRGEAPPQTPPSPALDVASRVRNYSSELLHSGLHFW